MSNKPDSTSFNEHTIALQTRRKHHFVPVFYLKRWAGSDGRLVEFQRPYREVKAKRTYPDATGYEMDLYTMPGLPVGSEDYLESAFMSRVDQLASDAIKLLLEGRDNFTATIKSGLSRFIMSLLHRDPESLRQTFGEFEAD